MYLGLGRIIMYRLIGYIWSAILGRTIHSYLISRKDNSASFLISTIVAGACFWLWTKALTFLDAGKLMLSFLRFVKIPQSIWRENMLGYLSADIICCELWGTDNVQGQYPSVFFRQLNGGYWVYYPSNIFPNTRGFENWGVSPGYSLVLAGVYSVTWLL